MYFKDNKVFIDAELYYTVTRRGKRIIFAPCKELKTLQRHFLNAIRWSYNLNLSTLDCAKVHTGKKWILKMDIKDFYSSVSSSAIQEFLLKVCNNIKYANVEYYYWLVTLYDKLPTGAPTSAHIANACFESIEKKIKNFCQIYDVTFSKYMDDLIFSSNSKDTLKIIEQRVEDLLDVNGYQINKQKTKYISDNKRQEILGIVVNDKSPRLPKELKRKIRSMIFKLAQTISPTIITSINDCVNEEQVRGYISYVKSVDKPYYDKLCEYNKKLVKQFKLDKLEI
ncbi:RNA-directed DNA polymerase [bacterium]|nr:RNA-directed DNA polymerase [bacterium]